MSVIPIPLKNLKWWVLVATSSSLAMIFLDQSALPIALPSIQHEWSLSSELLQWINNAYLLTLAVLIILGGKLGDRLSHRNVFLAGMVIFILSSILCAASPTITWLIIGRVLQGVGGSLMMPSASPLFRTVVNSEEFGKMVGLYVSIASTFLILGPMLGGFFVAYLSWRWIFWINFPVALIAISIIVFVVPLIKEYKVVEKSFDWIGFITLTLCLICLVFALMQGQTLGWSSAVILTCFLTAIIAFAIFLQVEKKHHSPFIDFKIFQNKTIAHGVLAMSLIQIAYMSMIFWVMFLQYTLSLSPQKTGIFLLSAQVPVLLVSGLAGRLLDKKGPRFPVTLGTLMITISSLWITVFAWKYDLLWICPALILFGAGSPLVSIGIMSTTVSSASIEKRGVVSGIISAARQVGGSIGLAILVALETNVTSQVWQHWQEHATGALKKLPLSQLHPLMIGNSLPELTASEWQLAHQAAIHAYTMGFSCIMLFVTFCAFISFFISRKLPNHPLRY
jgi:EmrB/QacA subfamily drug resistance transporter